MSLKKVNISPTLNWTLWALFCAKVPLFEVFLTNYLSYTEKLLGRNTLMFLIVTNLAVYIMETFLLKVIDFGWAVLSCIIAPCHQYWKYLDKLKNIYNFQTNIYKAESSFYGIWLWIVLSHITLPLCIFYRLIIYSLISWLIN